MLDGGERGATLDAVARDAGVSKGGLIYHFPSREALVVGLCERFTDLVEADIVAMRDAKQSPSEWYVGTSVAYSSELERTMAALARLAPTNEDLVRPVLRAGRSRWFDLIVDELGDRELAMAVVLLGDGISYNAELDGTSTSGEGFADAAVVDRILRALKSTSRRLSG